MLITYGNPGVECPIASAEGQHVGHGAEHGETVLGPHRHARFLERGKINEKLTAIGRMFTPEEMHYVFVLVADFRF